MENLGTHVTCIWLYGCRFAGNKGRNHHKIEWNIIWRDGQQREKPCSNIQYGTIKWYTIMIIEVIFIGNVNKKMKKITQSGKLPQINKTANSQIITRWNLQKNLFTAKRQNSISFHLKPFFFRMQKFEFVGHWVSELNE